MRQDLLDRTRVLKKYWPPQDAWPHIHPTRFVEWNDEFNIATYLVGCFEEQTPFMRKKNLAAHVGGWIIEGKSGKGGGLKEIVTTFVPYMKG